MAEVLKLLAAGEEELARTQRNAEQEKQALQAVIVELKASDAAALRAQATALKAKLKELGERLTVTEGLNMEMKTQLKPQCEFYDHVKDILRSTNPTNLKNCSVKGTVAPAEPTEQKEQISTRGGSEGQMEGSETTTGNASDTRHSKSEKESESESEVSQLRRRFQALSELVASMNSKQPAAGQFPQHDTKGEDSESTTGGPAVVAEKQHVVHKGLQKDRKTLEMELLSLRLVFKATKTKLQEERQRSTQLEAILETKIANLLQERDSLLAGNAAARTEPAPPVAVGQKEASAGSMEALGFLRRSEQAKQRGKLAERVVGERLRAMDQTEANNLNNSDKSSRKTSRHRSGRADVGQELQHPYPYPQRSRNKASSSGGRAGTYPVASGNGASKSRAQVSSLAVRARTSPSSPRRGGRSPRRPTLAASANGGIGEGSSSVPSRRPTKRIGTTGNSEIGKKDSIKNRSTPLTGHSTDRDGRKVITDPLRGGWRI